MYSELLPPTCAEEYVLWSMYCSAMNKVESLDLTDETVF